MGESLGDKLTAVTPILTIGVGLFAMFLGVPNWWWVFVFGWVVATPLVAILFGSRGAGGDIDELVDDYMAAEVRDALDADDGLGDRGDALDVLRERYARGDLTDAEFERKVERLLETESIEDAETLLTGDSAAAPTTESELERE